MNIIKRFFTVLSFVMILGIGCTAQAQDKVIYHIDNAEMQGIKALRNMRNHLDVSPETKIIAVMHAEGIDMMLEGAKNQKANIEYAPLIGALKSRGVQFEVCEITIKTRNLSKDEFILDADFTPSGVVRITNLQNKEHFAYLKP